MPENMSNTIFFKILPVLLAAAIVWMMTSINNLQIELARIQEQQKDSYQLLQITLSSVEKLETKIVTQQIELKVLEGQLTSLREQAGSHNGR